MKRNVAVFFGGVSVEHDISVITGLQVLANLDRERENVIPIYIAKDGRFLTDEKFWDIESFADGGNFAKAKQVILGEGGRLFWEKGKRAKLLCKIDFAYLALHGGMGESGCVQGLLDCCGVKYSSCDCHASSVCMNKFLTKLVAKEQKIPVAKGVLLVERDKNIPAEELFERVKGLNYPIVVKPNNLGSSIGITFCKDQEMLQGAVSFAFLFDREVLCEEAVCNLRELNIACLGAGDMCECSLVEEVTPNNDFLTFENKYLGGGKGMESQKRIVPASVSKKILNRIEIYAKKMFEAVKMKGCVRMDFLMDEKTETVYLNEVNPIPGSLANYLWGNKGYSFGDLLEKMKDYSAFESDEKDKKVTQFSSSVLKNFATSTAEKFGK
ncbi:MAG: D-alanine--D-alanine ligase family protein [Christensenellales bacterium]